MLRVTVHDNPESLTIQLEGRLTGPWVQEAVNCWQRLLAGERRPVARLDLTGVTMIDAAGRDFLAAAHARKTELLAAGSLMRAIVAGITHTTVSDCDCL